MALAVAVTVRNAAGALASASASAEVLAEPAGLVVELALPSGALTFSQAEAVDLGDYVGKFVRQRCLMQRQGAWTVFFRPDAGGARQEIVVEYGGYDFSVSPTKPVGTPTHILSPYTATIRRGTETLATVTVPKQYWLTRWRWQSAPRPIVRSHADLVAMKAILPLDAQALWNNPPNFSPAVSWSGPMGTAGINTAMGTTGDRQEIGPITNVQGSYLVRGNPEARVGMLAQAEAVGSFPFWLRDGSNLLDVYARPYHGLNFTADAARYPKLSPTWPANDASFFRLDTAHFPAVAFVPWLLTDDPYFLEGGQASAIFAAVEANYHQLNQKLPGLANPSQKRGWGWGVREILRMAALAPETAPSWLRPRSMFRKMAADNLAYVQRHMASPIKACRIFHVAIGNASIDPWVEGYVMSVLGWARWTRFFPEWDAAVDWMADVLLQTTADPAFGGWDRRWPAAYRIILNRARKAAVDKTVPLTGIAYNANAEPYADETPDSWGELWTLYKQRMALDGTLITVGSDDKIYENRTDNPGSTPTGPHYHEVVLGALGALAFGGTPNAKAHYDWMRSKMQPVYDSYGSGIKSSFRYAYLA